jgi:myo-inositol 2-dehydrogenase/D-chiro-inositol 1-dehydrogenase
MSLQVGVIGAGLMGTTHVRALAAAVPTADVVAVSDARLESAERLAEEVGVETVYGDPLELIRDPGVEAVVIASPAETHEPFVFACFEAEKPVLCEKPLASSARAARRVLDAEAALGRRHVQVGFMRRFDPAYVELKSRVDSGAIGTPLLLHCAHRNPAVPPSFGSEMILTDSVVHDVDTLRWLLGQEIVKVTVFTPRPTGNAPTGVHDPQMVLFETHEGAMVDVEAFVNARYAYDIRCEIVGESGTAALAPAGRVQLRRDGHAGTELPMGFQERFEAAYVEELQGWIASIASGVSCGASAWDGYAASVVCEAAVRSLATGAPGGGAPRVPPRPLRRTRPPGRRRPVGAPYPGANAAPRRPTNKD